MLLYENFQMFRPPSPTDSTNSSSSSSSTSNSDAVIPPPSAGPAGDAGADSAAGPNAINFSMEENILDLSGQEEHPSTASPSTQMSQDRSDTENTP